MKNEYIKIARYFDKVKNGMMIQRQEAGDYIFTDGYICIKTDPATYEKYFHDEKPRCFKILEAGEAIRDGRPADLHLDNIFSNLEPGEELTDPGVKIRHDVKGKTDYAPVLICGGALMVFNPALFDIFAGVITTWRAWSNTRPAFGTDNNITAVVCPLQPGANAGEAGAALEMFRQVYAA